MADVNKLLMDSPLPALIEGIGIAISRAQLAMDESSVKILQQMATTQIDLGSAGGTARPKRTLLELGFTPAFYNITEVTLEARVSFTTTTSKEVDVSAGIKLGSPLSIVCASVDAHYSNKYSFSAEGSSSIKARFVALPPPQLLRDAIEADPKVVAQQEAAAKKKAAQATP